ncbi:plastid division protein pdv2 [Phtheirospermum japonicum]|uniref:Plastid division protein pdv2 n=1 Tax=Phtheirospermum japonicum TaxID=374723 RepID=A0A830C7A0_9LAMI|nr:plastid division protein pdv2 [Phtheirospermum japonicum]
MEFKNVDHLQVLVSKTWDLYVRIDEKINQNGFTFCSHCSNHGRYCVVAESNLEEREKMIAIRDSLKDVHNILIFLQGAKSRQQSQRDDALANLEEARNNLIERINEYPEKGRKFDVLEELMTTFVKDGNFKARKMDEKTELDNKNVNSGLFPSFLANITRFGLEFVVVFASIYASAKLCKSRQKSNMLEKEVVAPMDSSVCLDVLCGRG